MRQPKPLIKRAHLDNPESLTSLLIPNVAPLYLTDDYVELSGLISRDLQLEAGFYKVTEDDLTIAPGVTVRVMPETVLEFGQGRKFYIHGRLEVEELDFSPVFIRGLDSAKWGGIEVWSEFWENQASAVFRHVVIQNAVDAINVGPRAKVVVEKGSKLRYNSNLSRYILGHLVIRESEIYENDRGWVVRSIGENPDDTERVGHLELENNFISETRQPITTLEYGRITLKNRPYLDLLTPSEIRTKARGLTTLV